MNPSFIRTQELCESRSGRPGLPVPISLYGLCGRTETLNPSFIRTQELCESRGGRPGPPSLLFFMVSVNAKQHWTLACPVFCGHHHARCGPLAPRSQARRGQRRTTPHLPQVLKHQKWSCIWAHSDVKIFFKRYVLSALFSRPIATCKLCSLSIFF